MCFVTSCLYGLSINTLDCLCRRVAAYISPAFQVDIFVQMVIFLGKENDLNIFNVKNKYGFEFTKTFHTQGSLQFHTKCRLLCFCRRFFDPGLGSTQETSPNGIILL